MNKKELQGLIKECFVELLREGSLLTEKFASKKVQYIFNKLKNQDKGVFQKMHNSHGIAWDQVDDSFVTKGADTKKGLNFFFINGTKKNPYAKRDWDKTMSGPALLGVTMGKSVVYQGTDYLTTSKGSSSWRNRTRTVGGEYGTFFKEMNNFKRMKELADEVWNVDHIGASKAYDTSDKTAERAKAKEGATALMRAKDMALANRKRYEKILSDRIAKSGPADQAIKMVEAITNEYNKAIQKRLEMLKKGKIADTWSSSYMGTISSAYDRIIREFEYLMREEKSMMQARKKDIEKGVKKGDWSEEKYYKDRMVEHARNIQKYYKQFKAANKKVDMAKAFYDVSG